MKRSAPTENRRPSRTHDHLRCGRAAGAGVPLRIRRQSFLASKQRRTPVNGVFGFASAAEREGSERSGGTPPYPANGSCGQA